jgi:hypothetical protein
MDQSQQVQIKSDFADKISGNFGAWNYRKSGLISKEKSMLVYDACLEVLGSGRQFSTTREFKQAVRARLCDQPYGFDPLTLLLIAKLIFLFIELWFAFNAQVRGMREG